MAHHDAEHGKDVKLASGTEALLRVERNAVAHPSSKALQRKTRGESASRLKKFAEIERRSQ